MVAVLVVWRGLNDLAKNAASSISIRDKRERGTFYWLLLRVSDRVNRWFASHGWKAKLIGRDDKSLGFLLTPLFGSIERAIERAINRKYFPKGTEEGSDNHYHQCSLKDWDSPDAMVVANTVIDRSDIRHERRKAHKTNALWGRMLLLRMRIISKEAITR